MRLALVQISMRRFCLLMVFVAVCCVPLSAATLGDIPAPTPTPLGTGSPTASQPSWPTRVGLGLIAGFQGLVSPLDGPRSPSYPTGSAYGKEAIAHYGLFWGVVLTADRLLHEADVPLGPMVEHHGKERFFDPLERNDFWLRPDP